MKDIVSLLKKSANNFDKMAQLGKKLISSAILSKCGFRTERGILCKVMLTDLLKLAINCVTPKLDSISMR